MGKKRDTSTIHLPLKAAVKTEAPNTMEDDSMVRFTHVTVCFTGALHFPS